MRTKVGILRTDQSMKDEAKTKVQLLNELSVLRQQAARLEESETKCADLTKALQESEERTSALQQSAQELSDLYNRAPCGYHSLDINGVFIRINDTELNWLGYTRDEVIGKKKFSDVITAKSLQVFHETFPQFKERGWIRDVEIEMVRKNGMVLPVLISATAVKDAEGNYVMSRSTVFDMTARRHAEDELRRSKEDLEIRVMERTAALRNAYEQLQNDMTERLRMEDVLRTSEKQFRTLYEQAPLGIALIDSHTGQFLQINPRYCEILGRTQEEMLKLNFQSVTHPDDLQADLDNMKKLLSGQSRFFKMEKRYVRTDGSVVWVSLTVVPMWGEGEHPDCHIAMVDDITERKQAEEALRISEEKYETLANFTYDWDDWLSPAGDYVYVSPSCETVTEYRSEEFMSDAGLFLRIIHPDDREVVEKHVHEALSGSSTVYHIDFRISTRSGEIRWISHYCQPVYSKEGKFLGRRGSNRNVTERKKKEEELEQLSKDLERLNVELSTTNDQLKDEIGSRILIEKALKEGEERYKKLVAAVTTYTYSVDLSQAGTITTSHSMGCIPITGYSPEDYQSDPYLWLKMVHPDDKRLVEDSTKEIQSSGSKVAPIEHRVIRRDGRVVWVRNTMVPYYDREGHLIRYDGLIEDITERKQAEQKLEETLRVWKTTFNAMNDILCLLDGNGTILQCNEAMSKFLNVPNGGVVGRKCYELLHGTGGFIDECPYRRMLRTRKRENFELTLGDKFYMVTVDPIFSETGEILGTVHIMRDTTMRRRAEEEIATLNRELEKKVSELMELNKELNAFNYSISHDLKIPLAVIGGFTNRLLKLYGDQLDNNALDMLATIQDSAQKTEKLIKDLLAFSRSGRQEIKPAEIGMESLLRAVLDELGPLTQGRMISFEIGALPQAYADRALIKQVLINLLSNAIKFTSLKDKAVIEVSGEQKGDESIYCIRDNGVGFPPQDAEELFSPFHRLYHKKEFEGTGVGLSIVQRIITRHHGRVWAEGRESEGAAFYFALPKGRTVQTDPDRVQASQA